MLDALRQAQGRRDGGWGIFNREWTRMNANVVEGGGEDRRQKSEFRRQESEWLMGDKGFRFQGEGCRMRDF